jgi:hypothetical protein
LIPLLVVLVGSLAGIQALFVHWNAISYARLVPLYIISWVLPPVVATRIAKERLSGRWQMSSITKLTTFDLWVSSIFAPAIPWLAAATFLWWPFWLPADTIFPQSGAVTLRIGVYLPRPDPWVYLIGILGSGVAYACLAGLCAFRARAPRAAVTGVLLINGAFSYAGAVLSLCSPVIGKWAEMPAFQYALFAQPFAILAPGWMVGGTIYSVDHGYIRKYIAWVTVTLFVVAAFILSAASYWVVERARRPKASA